MKILSLLILLTTALNEHGASAPNSNWPQWRGPLATGEAPNATPPQTWSETEHVKWKVKIPGSGTWILLLLAHHRWHAPVRVLRIARHPCIRHARQLEMGKRPGAHANQNGIRGREFSCIVRRYFSNKLGPRRG